MLHWLGFKKGVVFINMMMPRVIVGKQYWGSNFEGHNKVTGEYWEVYPKPSDDMLKLKYALLIDW